MESQNAKDWAARKVINTMPGIDGLISDWRQAASIVRRELDDDDTFRVELQVGLARFAPENLPKSPTAAAGLGWLLIAHELMHNVEFNRHAMPPAVSEWLDKMIITLLAVGVEAYTGNPLWPDLDHG